MLERLDKNGVTVLELIVTVAALIVAIVIIPPMLRTFVSKTHDIRRTSNVKELQSALQMYYLYNGIYPIVYPAQKIDGKDLLSKTLKQSFLVLGTRLPVDPMSPTFDYIYESSRDGKNFTITYCLELTIDELQKAGCDNKAYPKPMVTEEK
ncbi:MAG: hypothetical protein HZA95_03720 [Candidatus Vogelbacteria bacterium]|nr:hypothetical protein [Candidatus Vogelbacteria bacterium]